ncbi:hypothetical protein HDU98_007668 [Podochytrium sp. JEL0797]|nr:hypothetical protein HDU98_007668 [Podochytrium sp. JEL0797]
MHLEHLHRSVDRTMHRCFSSQTRARILHVLFLSFLVATPLFLFIAGLVLLLLGRPRFISSLGTTVSVSLTAESFSFEGFGTSLSWWANVAGGSSMEQTYARLLFTLDSVPIPNLNTTLPGLGLSVARYNIGGFGRPGDTANSTLHFNTSRPGTTIPTWWKEIEGFWIDPHRNKWDFSRDANQQSMLHAMLAVNPNVSVEMFSNAPMWWMTEQGSSLGGELMGSQVDAFAFYAASVAGNASRAGVKVVGVEVMNEPSSGWWNFGSLGQEGLNVPLANTQLDLLQAVRENLDSLGLGNVSVAGCDENNIPLALGNLASILPKVDRYNIHGYASSNGLRSQLRSALGNATLWMTEYGDGNNNGLDSVSAIVNDLNIMRCAAWVYWQAVENQIWGLLLASNFGDNATDASRAVPTAVTTKYFMVAQYSRFIRPGDLVLMSTSPGDTVVSYSKATGKFNFVFANFAYSRGVAFELGVVGKSVPGNVEVVFTRANGSVLFGSFEAKVVSAKLFFLADPDAVYSFSI